MLRKAQSFPTFNSALQNSNGYLPVGSGPISLSENPVLEVRGARDTSLWRTRIYDSYTGRGWRMSQPEDPDYPEQTKAEVPFQPPDFGTDASAEPYYQWEFKPDAQRR